MWYIPNGKRDPGEKADSHVCEGVFLGIKNQSTEALIGTDDGVISARTERWNKDIALKLKYSIASVLNSGLMPDDAVIDIPDCDHGDEPNVAGGDSGDGAVDFKENEATVETPRENVGDGQSQEVDDGANDGWNTVEHFPM